MTLYTGNLTPEEHEAEREAERETTTKSLMQTYKINPAKYAKNKMAVHCISDGSGYKTLAALIISTMPNVRYSGREHAYIVSPRAAAKFEAEMARIENRRAVSKLVGETHATRMFIDHIDGDVTNNDLANLRAVSPKENCR